MRVVFRVDASLRIGIGHVMRCVTLADALRLNGVDTHFICRKHQGHVIDQITAKAHNVHALPVHEELIEKQIVAEGTSKELNHANWLGATQWADAEACQKILTSLRPNWLIVDHYGIDACWETQMANHCESLMVIDDLADRQHICQLLLDQTYARDPKDYKEKVPKDCTLLCGTEHALIRPEFSALREASIKRRSPPALRELLVFLGGIDEHDVTGEVLSALSSAPLPSDCRITVVLGATAPWIKKVCNQALSMPRPTRVLIGVENMAQIMHDCDAAIGAVGTATWERCSLGIPTGVVILADNQRYACKQLMRANAIYMLGERNSLEDSVIAFIASLSNDAALMAKIGENASLIADGRGCERVVKHLLAKHAS